VANKMKIQTRGDREVLITREFNAPRKLVWDAHTKPELLKRWLFGPDGWELAVCDMDLRVGGKYRWVWKKAEIEMGMGGVFKEVKAPERLVATGKFDEAWYPGEELNTSVFTEKAGKTTLSLTVRYDTPEAREIALKSPMDEGMALGYDRLEKVLATLK
jgi:uncharacterized protein YndB with AHSA1/START domain